MLSRRQADLAPRLPYSPHSLSTEARVTCSRSWPGAEPYGAAPHLILGETGLRSPDPPCTGLAQPEIYHGSALCAVIAYARSNPVCRESYGDQHGTDSDQPRCRSAWRRGCGQVIADFRSRYDW